MKYKYIKTKVKIKNLCAYPACEPLENQRICRPTTIKKYKITEIQLFFGKKFKKLGEYKTSILGVLKRSEYLSLVIYLNFFAKSPFIIHTLSVCK